MRRHMLHRAAGLLLALAAAASLPGVAAEEEAVQPLSHSWLIQPGYQMAENSRFALYYDPEGLDLAVLEKTTGFVWSNAVDREVYTEEAANETALSGLVNVGTLNGGAESQTVIYDGVKNASSVKTAVEKRQNGFSLQISLVKLDIRFTLQFTLEKDGLDVRVPFDKIEENGKNQLNYLRLMPFFGAGVSGEGGYLFFPDGSGSLMDFTENDRFSGCTNLSFYGDQAPDIDADESRLENGLENLGLPVFGLKSGARAFLGNVYAGSADALLTVAPGGYIYTRLNRVYVTLNYRRTYTYKTEDEKEQQYTDSELIRGDRGIFYSLLSGEDADYSGMARAYRGYLTENGLRKQTAAGEDVPLFITFFGGIKAKSFLFDRFVSMTTFEQAGDILADLRGAGVSRMACELIGWSKGGYGAVPTTTSPAWQLGGKNGLNALYALAESQEIPIYLQADTMTGSTAHGGYNTRKDAVREYPGIIVADSATGKRNLLSPFVVKKSLFPALDRFLEQFQLFRVSLTGWGERLHYDFNRSRPYSRTDTMEGMKDLLAEFTATHPQTAVEGNNLYAALYASQLINLPDSDSGYRMADRSIPFYQMVMHGYKPYTTVAGNTTYDLTEQKLRWAEYGAQPYFILTRERAEELQGTDYNRLFTSEYSLWKDRVVEAYQWYNETMKPVYGTPMLEHAQLEEGLVRVRYENGYTVYVNYQAEDRECDGVSVPAQSVEVVKG